MPIESLYYLLHRFLTYFIAETRFFGGSFGFIFSSFGLEADED